MSEWQAKLAPVMWVSLGGVLGANARYGVSLLATRLTAAGLPWGTLAVNLTGSLALGILYGWLARRAEGALAENLRLFAGVGFLGAYTTFSTFALECHRLFETQAWVKGLAYAVGSVVLGIVAVGLGIALGDRLAR